MIRVGIIGLQHESNTFIAETTKWQDFSADVLARGHEVQEKFIDSHHEIGGFFEGLQSRDFEAVPLLVARATPGGVIDSSASDRLIKEIHAALQQTEPLDGLLVAPHGAGVSQNQNDFDGFWLSQLRQQVGSTIPVVSTLDLHANVSTAMIQSCQAMLAYRTNPHLDQRARGIEAAELLQRRLRGEILPVQAAAFLPMAVGIERQHTGTEPCQSLFLMARDFERRPGILSVSVVLGFPYSDVPEMGCCVIVVADRELELAQVVCREFADRWWDRRAEFESQLIGIEEGIETAAASVGPVGLLDMGDNVGGGSPGDGTSIAQAVLRRGGPKTLVCISDPQAVSAALEIGVHGELTGFEIGGKADDRHGTPLVIRGCITGITDGHFRESEVRHGGKKEYDMGPTVVIECDSGLTAIVHSRRTPPFSLGQVTSVGVDPKGFQLIVLKGVQAPIAAYQPVCHSFLRINTPGSTTADLFQLEFSRRRMPMFPWEKTGGQIEYVTSAR